MSAQLISTLHYFLSSDETQLFWDNSMSQACQGWVETVLKHWNRLPRAGMESPPLEYSKKVFVALGTWFIWFSGKHGDGLMAGFDDLRGLFQP